jgi:uncharacterized protein YecT (DUF1311 family)
MRFLLFCLSSLLVLSTETQATTSDDVVKELSRRSAIPVSELNELLGDCSRDQLSMNLCAFRDFVLADMDIQQAANDALASLPSGCHARLVERQAAWARKRDRDCKLAADDEAGEGSMRPMIYSACRTTATRSRTKVVAAIRSCEGVR